MFRFPLTVNEKAARVVAGVVAGTSVVAVLTGALWLLVPLAYGFWARVLSGPTFSPLALFATKIAAPRLGPPRQVPGPPKRFAQGIGAAFTTAALVAWLAFDAPGVAEGLLLALAVAATLESVFALCLGCKAFAGLMRLGLVPQRVCEQCAAMPQRG